MLHVIKADCALRKVEQHFATSSLKSDTILLTRGSLTFTSTDVSGSEEGMKISGPNRTPSLTSAMPVQSSMS